MIKQTTQLLVLGTVALVLVSAISGCLSEPEPTPSPTPTATATPVPPPTFTPSPTATPVPPPTPTRTPTPTPVPPPTPTPTVTINGHPSDPCGPDSYGYGDLFDLHEHFIHWAEGGTHLVFDHDDLILALDIAGAQVREVADVDADYHYSGSYGGFLQIRVWVLRRRIAGRFSGRLFHL